jgi:hypothetical protein
MNSSSSPALSRTKLVRVLNLLNSPVDGEALGAARAAARMLAAAGLHSFEEVIEAPVATPAPARPSAPDTDVEEMLDGLVGAHGLTSWEAAFVYSLNAQARNGRPLTAKQIAKLKQIAWEHL